MQSMDLIVQRVSSSPSCDRVRFNVSMHAISTEFRIVVTLSKRWLSVRGTIGVWIQTNITPGAVRLY